MRRGSQNTAPVPAPDAVEVLLRGLNPQRRTRIVDVGANPLDAPPYAALLKMGACDVLGFEPQPDAYARLMAARGAHETYLPFAVGDGSEKTLHVYRRSGFTSVFLPNVPGTMALGTPGWARVERQLPMQTVALDTDARVGPMDMLKIDIQGGEVDVFRGATGALAVATAVIVELRYFPIYDSEPMVGGVDAELRRQGFILHKFLFTKSRMLPNSQSARLQERQVKDQAIDGDAVYLRRLEALPDCTDEALKHLCVLAAGVFHSHSLVVHVLDLLVGRGRVAPGLPATYVDALPDGLRMAG